MLPCNVIVQEIEAGIIEVAAVNPIASLQAVDNENQNEVVNEIATMLENVIKKISDLSMPKSTVYTSKFGKKLESTLNDFNLSGYTTEQLEKHKDIFAAIKEHA